MTTIKLTETQKTILKTAVNRPDGAIHPLPERIKGGAVIKVIDSLENKGLAGHGGNPDGDENLPILITVAGRIAIGLEPLDREPTDESFDADVTKAEQALGIAPAAVESETTPKTETTPTEEQPTQLETTANNDPSTEPTEETTTESKPSEKQPVKPRRTRKKSKQALMIKIMRRPEGATIDQIVTATEWQKHTIRGVISGAIKKRLGMTVVSEKNNQGQRIYKIPAA